MTDKKFKKTLKRKLNFYPKKKDVKIWFSLLNHYIFNDELEKFKSIIIKKKYKNVLMEIEGFHNKEGFPHCNLYLNDEFDSIRHFVSALAHEMVHHWQWTIEGEQNINHNKSFFSWKNKLKKLDISLGINT